MRFLPLGARPSSAILEMEVDNLFQHNAALTVTQDCQTLSQRIIDANSDDFPHGAEILTHVQQPAPRQYVTVFHLV